MNIQTKYSVGDKVRVKADPIIQTTCPFCGGAGKAEVSGTTLFCQNCNGAGVFTSRLSNQRQLVEGTVKSIHLTVEQWNRNLEDDDDAEQVGSCGIFEEYVVDVPDEYWGNGTYSVNKIYPLED